MKVDQLVRVVGVVGVVAVTVARLAYVGNGTVDVLGYGMEPVVLAVLAVLVLAAPETVDRLPWGPSRGKD